MYRERERDPPPCLDIPVGLSTARVILAQGLRRLVFSASCQRQQMIPEGNPVGSLSLASYNDSCS